MIRKIFPFLGGLRVSVWQHRNVEPAFWHFGAAAAEESYGIIPIPFRVVATIAYGVSFSIFFASAQSEQVRLCTRLSENVFPDCPKNGSRSYPTQGYALFARVRMHPSPAMDGDATQRRIVPKVIPGR